MALARGIFLALIGVVLGQSGSPLDLSTSPSPINGCPPPPQCAAPPQNCEYSMEYDRNGCPIGCGDLECDCTDAWFCDSDCQWARDSTWLLGASQCPQPRAACTAGQDYCTGVCPSFESSAELNGLNSDDASRSFLCQQPCAPDNTCSDGLICCQTGGCGLTCQPPVQGECVCGEPCYSEQTGPGVCQVDGQCAINIRPPRCDDIFCTADAKLCPDGSTVSRDPANNCEFPECPAVPCTDDVRVCWDGSSVSRVPPNCDFADCPPCMVVDCLPGYTLVGAVNGCGGRCEPQCENAWVCDSNCEWTRRPLAFGGFDSTNQLWSDCPQPEEDCNAGQDSCIGVCPSFASSTDEELNGANSAASRSLLCQQPCPADGACSDGQLCCETGSCGLTCQRPVVGDCVCGEACYSEQLGDVGVCQVDGQCAINLREPQCGCPEDLKLCPDGSYVGRDANNDCEFEECPNPDCTDDVQECPDGSYVSRDPANNCEFEECPCETIVCIGTAVLVGADPVTGCGGRCVNNPVCPPLQGNTVGNCAESCAPRRASLDLQPADGFATALNQCSGGQLCCSNGCGRSCQDPVEGCTPPACAPPGPNCEWVDPVYDENECLISCGTRQCAPDCSLRGAFYTLNDDRTDCVCTADVQECRDGSTVSRDPANGCEFEECPPCDMIVCIGTAVLVGADPITGCGGRCVNNPVCPPLQDSSVGHCTELCTPRRDSLLPVAVFDSTRDQCSGGQLCCSNGCGHSCQDPVEGCDLLECPAPPSNCEYVDQLYDDNGCLISCGTFDCIPDCIHRGEFFVPDGTGDGCVCTDDAQICPDGSTVSRDPNNGCEFEECPPCDMIMCIGTAVLVGADPVTGCGGRCVNNPVCPPLQDGSAGHCAEMCTPNSLLPVAGFDATRDQCSGGQLCCSNGCGHSCQDPVEGCDLLECPAPPSNCEYVDQLYDDNGCLISCGTFDCIPDCIHRGEFFVPDGTGDGCVCTDDAQICPDGSTVSRDPNNNCEFDPCPLPCDPVLDSAGQQINCGRLGSQGECPDGSVCNVSPTDTYAICCRREEECGENEHYEGCGSACPAVCGDDAVGPCPTVCVPGCFCDDGYTFDEASGLCVEQCPTVCPVFACELPEPGCVYGEPTVDPVTGCATDCGPLECVCPPIACRAPDPGCVYGEPTVDPVTGCTTDCGPLICEEECGDNEEYNACGTACPSVCGDDELVPCTTDCVAGCFCIDGYTLDEEGGTCIPEERCPPDCPVYGQPCRALPEHCRYEPSFDDNGCPLPCGEVVCGPECPVFRDESQLDRELAALNGESCRFDETCFYGEETCCGETHPSWFLDCSQGTMGYGYTDACFAPCEEECGENEEYDACGSACPSVCGDDELGPCTTECAVGCFCQDGFIREEEGGACIPEDACPPEACNRDAKECPDGSFVSRDPNNNCEFPDCPEEECGRNEEYKACGTACPSVCGDDEPSLCTTDCVAGCFCQDGYTLDEEGGECIPEDDCPPEDLYNCYSREEWSDEKREWCCENYELGCPEPLPCDPVQDDNGENLYCGRGEGTVECPRGSECTIDDGDRYAVCCPVTEPYNCYTKEVWSDDKTEWCCENYGLGCPVDECRDNEEYQACGTACPAVCGDDAVGPCPTVCVAGCFCKDGFTLKEEGGLCIPVEDCPPDACLKDAKECPDGSVVGRDPNNNCEFPDCPDTECPEVLCVDAPESCEWVATVDDKGCLNPCGDSECDRPKCEGKRKNGKKCKGRIKIKVEIGGLSDDAIAQIKESKKALAVIVRVYKRELAAYLGIPKKHLKIKILLNGVRLSEASRSLLNTPEIEVDASVVDTDLDDDTTNKLAEMVEAMADPDSEQSADLSDRVQKATGDLSTEDPEVSAWFSGAVVAAEPQGFTEWQETEEDAPVGEKIEEGVDYEELYYDSGTSIVYNVAVLALLALAVAAGN